MRRLTWQRWSAVAVLSFGLFGCYVDHTITLPTALFEETDVTISERSTRSLVLVEGDAPALPTESGYIAVLPLQGVNSIEEPRPEGTPEPDEGAEPTSPPPSEPFAEAIRTALREELTDLSDNYPNLCEGREPCFAVLDRETTRELAVPINSIDALIRLREDSNVEWVIVAERTSSPQHRDAVFVQVVSTSDGSVGLSFHGRASDPDGIAALVSDELIPEATRQEQLTRIPVTQRMPAVVAIVDRPIVVQRAATRFYLGAQAIAQLAPRSVIPTYTLVVGLRFGEGKAHHRLWLGGTLIPSVSDVAACSGFAGEDPGGGLRLGWDFRYAMTELFYVSSEFTAGATFTETDFCRDGVEFGLTTLEILSAGGSAGITLGGLQFGVLARLGFGPWEEQDFRTFTASDEGFLHFSGGITADMTF